MGKNFSLMEDSNRSGNPSIHDVSARRRLVLQGGLGAALTGLLAPLAGCATAPASCALARGAPGFTSVPVSTADSIAVPPGYIADVIAAWGEPVGIAGSLPAFREDAGNSADEQALQMGMHHDGIHYYPLDGGSSRGLLVMNHEYVDEGPLFPAGSSRSTR
jgi:secreted PhoX family phosphatase